MSQSDIERPTPALHRTAEGRRGCNRFDPPRNEQNIEPIMRQTVC